MFRPIVGSTLLVLAMLSLPACKKPDPTESSGYGRYAFDLQIEADAAVGFVCIASVLDQVGNVSLRTKPFRALPGKPASASVDEPVSGSRFEATVTVDATSANATYTARLTQPGNKARTFEATRAIPKS